MALAGRSGFLRDKVFDIVSLQSLACAVGMHHRDPARSRAEDGRYVGECAGCGRPMVWTLSGWKLDRKPAYPHASHH